MWRLLCLVLCRIFSCALLCRILGKPPCLLSSYQTSQKSNDASNNTSVSWCLFMVTCGVNPYLHAVHNTQCTYPILDLLLSHYFLIPTLTPLLPPCTTWDAHFACMKRNRVWFSSKVDGYEIIRKGEIESYRGDWSVVGIWRVTWSIICPFQPRYPVATFSKLSVFSLHTPSQN